MQRANTLLLSITLTLWGAQRAQAVDVLVLCDRGSTDAEIATALSDAGHTVTYVTDDFTLDTSSGSDVFTNPTLLAPLDAYAVIVWIANGGLDPSVGAGSRGHNDPRVFDNLTRFLNRGGRLLVTGTAGTIRTDLDALLVALVGAESVNFAFYPPSPISTEPSSLTVGEVDIRGVRPTAGTLMGDLRSYRDDCLHTLRGTRTVVQNGADDCAQWALRSVGGGEVAWISNDNPALWIEPTRLESGLGTYNCALRNFVHFAADLLTEPGAPALEIVVPANALEGPGIAVGAHVTDAEGDAFHFSWDLDADHTFGDQPDAPSAGLPGIVDGPTAVTVGLRAQDSGGHTATLYRSFWVDNVGPQITSSAPTEVAVGQQYQYALAIADPAGALDPLTFSVQSGPPGLAISDQGLVSYLPAEATSAPVTVEIRVDDGDGGLATQQWMLSVNANQRPSAPQPSYPTSGLRISDTMPVLTTHNAEDGDLDPLTYAFEIDVLDSFDTDLLRRSGPIAESPGVTTFPIATPLDVGRTYYWRVRANDGKVDGDWGTANFVTGPEPRADAGPATPVSHGGCGVAGGPAPTWVWLVVLALLGVRRRRGRAI